MFIYTFIFKPILSNSFFKNWSSLCLKKNSSFVELLKGGFTLQMKTNNDISYTLMDQQKIFKSPSMSPHVVIHLFFLCIWPTFPNWVLFCYIYWIRQEWIKTTKVELKAVYFQLSLWMLPILGNTVYKASSLLEANNNSKTIQEVANTTRLSKSFFWS